MDFSQESLALHVKMRGKMEIVSKVPLDNLHDLSVAYTPGVAAPCIEISKNPEDVYKYTVKSHLVAVVTDGSAVLGLGNIGPMAGLPVMEGKAILFKRFANIDAVPICLDTQNADEIVETIVRIAPSFGGINLEDISAPKCFEVERRLSELLDIPVFHDDQHGTAIVVLAGLINALKLAEKDIADIKIVLSGAGAAGTAIARLLTSYGAKNIIACDTHGAIYTGRADLNEEKIELAQLTNPQQIKGSLADTLQNADVFIGISAPGLVTKQMVGTMAAKAIVFAMANPTPEIMPDEAKAAGTFIVASGRSDYPNQINNVLAFPGVFKGLLDCKAKRVDTTMKIAAAKAIAQLVLEPDVNKIIPGPFDDGVADAVANAICEVAKQT